MWAVLVSYLVGILATALVLVSTKHLHRRCCLRARGGPAATPGAGCKFEKARHLDAASGHLQKNTASIALHTQAGFRIIGYRERIGQHRAVWRHTAQPERRSPTVGVA